MKISNISNAYDIYTKKPAVSGKKNKLSVKKDDLNVSDEAREFQNVFKAVSSTPDIREDKINRIKDKIESGNYNINSEDIADKMLSKWFKY